MPGLSSARAFVPGQLSIPNYVSARFGRCRLNYCSETLAESRARGTLLRATLPEANLQQSLYVHLLYTLHGIVLYL